MIILCDMIDSPADLSKFQRIYERYHNTMYLVAYDILKNVHDAEDTVANSLIKVLGIMKKKNLFHWTATNSYAYIWVIALALLCFNKVNASISLTFGNAAGILLGQFWGGGFHQNPKHAKDNRRYGRAAGT